MDAEHQLANAHKEWVDANWLVLAYLDNPTIRVDARMLDRILADESDIVFGFDEMTASLRIMGGERVARHIADSLAPYTRSAPLLKADVYEHSKRRLAAINGLVGPKSVPAVLYNSEPVWASDKTLYIGDFAVCSLAKVDRCSVLGTELQVPNGWLQAGLAMFVVAARHENVEVLMQRISDYEARCAAVVSDQDGSGKLDY